MNRPRGYQDLGTTCCYSLSTSVCGDAFVDGSCFNFYISRLLNRSSMYRVRLHAYCLLQREILLLATHGSDASIQALITSVDSSYCDYFNLRFNRYLSKLSTARHSLAILDNPALLECQKFLETEPCRSLGFRHPGEYHWSSYNKHAFGGRVRGLVRHQALRNYLKQSADGYAAYRAYLARAFTPARQRYLEIQLRHGRFLASDLRRQKRRKSAA